MSLPELPEDPLSPGECAERVTRLEPHGLDMLEAHVLAYATDADALSKLSPWKIAWGVAPPFLSVFASIGGFAALFGSPEHINRGWVEEPDMTAVPWASLCYGVAIGGVILLLVHWFQAGRRRYPGMLYYLGVTFVFGALGVPVAFGIAAEAGTGLGLMILPTYVMMGLAAIVFVIIQFSPRPDPEPERPILTIDDLDDKAMRTLMRERRNAIKKLWLRGRLPDVDLKKLRQLQARPLGRLHIDDDAAEG